MLDVFAARPWREAEGRILLFGVVVDGWRGGRCGAMVGKVMQLDEGDAPLDEGADADWMRMVRARTAMEERWRGSGRACRKSTERSLNAIFLEAGASRIHESVVL